MDKIQLGLLDLSFLEWSKIRESSGTAGSFLKSYIKTKDKKVYFKLSDYNQTDGIIGHECINEIIVDRLLTILGINHLNYYLLYSEIDIDRRTYHTHLCASLDFKEKNEIKVTLETFYDLNKLENESILDFCIRKGWKNEIYQMILVDYLIINRDRHGANIEVLINPNKNKTRLAPLFDHGLSLISRTLKEEDIDKFEPLKDIVTNSFIGSRSLFENLKYVINDELPEVNKLSINDKDKIFYGLDYIISEKRINKIWEILWQRWCVYESMCNKKYK